MTTPQFITVAKTPELLDALLVELDAARAKVAGDSRWLNALDAAQDYFHWAASFDWDAAHSALRVASATEPGRAYIANGACQCAAFAKSPEPKACWHRAAARVLRNALTRQAHARRERAFSDIAELFA